MEDAVLKPLLCLLYLLPVTAAAQGGPPPAPVRVAEAQMASLAPSIQVPGTVVSRNDARVAAEVGGRLTWIAEIGASVPAGEPVARIDDAELILQRDEFRGVLASQESRRGFLEREAERLRRLAAENNAAKNQLDQVETELQSAISDIAVARARLGQIELQLARTRVRAPFDGIVTERLLTAGEYASPGDDVVRMVDPGELEVVARAPLSSLSFVETGGELQFHSQRHVGTGVVRALVPFGDSRSHMFELRLSVPSSPWRVGENVRLSVPTGTPTEVLAVPRDALVLRREGASVFRVGANDTAERIDVIPGVGAGELVAVTGQISAGDRVVVRGAERLRAGQPVNILSD
ncbi:MAG TPA: efflux RND transporter periplasmic adaptor subunit [Gammaproteobacteria bacterium]|nr:efflux RND transporter periplasmic adaptor subunit [Gammaproteobacteria bacterium]